MPLTFYKTNYVGNLILIALHLLQLESGCGFHLLEWPSESVPYITQCWLTSIQDFMDCSKIKIKVTTSRWVLISCKQDWYLMDEFCTWILQQSTTFWPQCNENVPTSDNAAKCSGWDGRGKHIIVKTYKGKKPLDQFSTLKWPAMTTSHHYKEKQNLWKAALEVAFTSSW
jgi:hypothetical protein